MVESLRERTRRVVRAELVDAAQDLFVQQGYAATTIEQIAAAAGLSRRSFFRYFASKEDLILDKLIAGNNQMIEEFQNAPAELDVWDALRESFSYVGRYVSTAGNRERADVLAAIINDDPALRGAQLAQFAALQDRLLHAAAERDGGARSEVALRALVAGAFACLQIAMDSAEPPEFSERLDAAMAALHPLQS